MAEAAMRKVGIAILVVGMVMIGSGVGVQVSAVPVGASGCGPYDPLDICCWARPEKCGLQEEWNTDTLTDVQNIGR